MAASKGSAAKDSLMKKSASQRAADARSRVRSAPELPRHIAKEYGLHYEQDSGPASAPKPQESVEISPALDDPRTERAVDDILAKESDELLGLHDESKPATPAKRTLRQKIARCFKAWWRNKWARWITIVVLVAAIIATAVVPKARYFVLNTVGVRSTASVVVLDGTTQLPLKSVSIAIGGTTVQTDIQGIARLSGLKLGDYQLQIKRIAFAPQTHQVTIGLGSNPLGSFQLRAVGIQYTITIKDFLSGKALEGAEAESEQGNALSDKKGKLILTVEDTDITKLTVQIRASGYRAETVELEAATALTSEQPLVPAGKAVFISKQTGKYDVVSSDVDGKNRKILLAGTGLETANISLVVSPDNTQAALISQRENVRDSDGYQLYSLTIIDIARGTGSVVDRAQQIVPIDWIGNRLVYRSTIAGASAANAQRNRLLSYNYESNARAQLATANQFNAAMSAKGMIYFAASSTDPRASLGLFRIRPDGSGRERVSSAEVWTALRSSFNTLSLQSPDGWYTHTLGTKDMVKTALAPDFVSYNFVPQPDTDAQLWVQARNGKDALLLKGGNGQDKQLAAEHGLTYPVYWAGPHAAMYSLTNANETAMYVVSPNGGPPRKVADVSPTRGFAQIN